jgi:microcystin-dependent protein
MKRKEMTLLLTVTALLVLLCVVGLVRAGPLAEPLSPADVPTMVSYQGHVTVSSQVYNGTGFFKFAIVDVSGTTTYWSNDGTSSSGGEPTNGTPLTVTRGLFNVLLGDTSLVNMTQSLDALTFGGANRYLRVWFSADNVNFQQLSPDQHIAAVPYALQASNADDADTVDGLHASDLVPPGTIVAYAGDTPPSGWLLCDGSAIGRAQYAALFLAIGTAHGEGDGTTTFNLPDYRGYFLRGVDMGAGRDPDAASRTVPNPGGNSGDAVGSVQNDQLQSHKHNDYGHDHGYTSQTHNATEDCASGGSHAAEDSWSGYQTTTGYANLGEPAPSSAGTVRHGLETRGKNAYVLWIVKY